MINEKWNERKKETMRKFKRLISGLLAAALVVANITITPQQELQVVKAAIESSDFIKANGTVLKNNYGSGDTIYLRGVNAGGYTLQEFWMCPTNYSNNCSDQDDIWRILTNRFGAEAAKTLVNAYESAYWTEADFDRIASLGMNCIRLPLWYRNFVDSNNNWYSNAFDRVDWFVREAGERGIYVIIDMHGAYGSQNGSDHSGVDGGDYKEAASEFFFGANAASNQEKYYQMWEKLAAHFKGNPTVAGYDLLNEPYCTYRYNSSYTEDYLHSLLWGIYDKAYDRIRAIDPDHLIIMEATWDGWDLPNPNDYGWSNVMYEYHQYEYSDYDNASGTQISSMQNKLNNIFCMNYNVPSYMGEFNYFNNTDAWAQGLQLLNNNGMNWTIWSYKCVSEYGNWGLVNQSVEKVNVETDSYDEILRKWSNVGSCYENTGLMNTVKNYTSGTVSPTEYATISDGAYYLVCNDKIVCADNYGNDPLIANRDSYSGAWETIHVVNNSDGTISFKSDINGKYVCAVIDENSQLLARSDAINDWEKFKLVHIQSNQYAIKCMANGMYVKADFGDTSYNGQLKAVSGSIGGAWEAFYFNMLEASDTTTQTPTSTEEQTTLDIPSDFTAATTNEWSTAGSWGCYFGNWNGTASGGYKLDGSQYKLYFSNTNTGAAWLAQARYDAATVNGHKYRITVNVTSDKAGSIGMKEDLSNSAAEPVYTNIVAGSNTLTGEYTVNQNAIRIMFELGVGISQGTSLTFNSITIQDITEDTTTIPQTTVEETTTVTDSPIEVIGHLVSCTIDNAITVVWGQNEAQIANGQTYNVYVDGVLKLNKVFCNQYTISGILAGVHTVKITAVLNGVESSGVVATVDVTGLSQFETTTEAPTTEIATTAKATETTTEEPTTKVHDSYSRIEAEAFSAKEGGVIDSNSNASGGYNIGGILDGVYFEYAVSFTENAGALNICYSSPSDTAQGNVEIYVDSMDNLVATVVLSNNSASWSEYGELTARLDKEIVAGTHIIYTKYVTTGTVPYVANVDYLSFVKASKVPMVDGGIEINGYQVSATAKGMRTLYSVEERIDGKEVVSSGLVYSLNEYAENNEMYVGSSSKYVKSYESTDAGLCNNNLSDSFTADSYAMTMRFAHGTVSEYTADWCVRAYAQLSDGTYVYSDIVKYTIYDIANKLYQDSSMNTSVAHDYLYTDILSVVKSDYVKIEYNLGNTIVSAD